MIAFIKNNGQLVILLVFWVIMGQLIKESFYLLVPLSFIILKRKNRFTEMIIAFAFILFMSDSRQHLLFDIGNGTRDIAMILLSIFFFFDTKQFPVKSKLFIPFILFLVTAFFVVSKNPNPVNSIERTVSYALLLIVIPNYFVRELYAHGEQFLRNLIGFCITYLFIGLLMIFPFHDFVYVGMRYNGLFGNPNGVGIMCTLLTILITVIKYHYPEIFTKRELYFIYAVILLSVILSSSRNCILSIMIFLFFIRFYKISYLYGFIIVIVVAIVFQFINENIVYIIDSLGLGEFFRVDHLDDGSGRLVAWNFAWQEIQRNFFLGKGFGYDKYYFDLHKEYLSTLGHQGGVHNSYLTIWMNTGLIGLILFVGAYLRIFFKAAATNYLAIPAMFAIMFTISFESWAASSLSPFTIILLLIITLLLYKKNEVPAKEALVPLQ